jgi:TonB family protein
MPVLESPPPVADGIAGSEPRVLPTLFGEGYGTYRARPGAFVSAYLLNLAFAALVIWSGHWVVAHRQEIKKQVVSLVTDISPYVLPPSKTEAGGGGGGGDRDKLEASKGSPPKFAREQITPPAIVVRNDNPKLAVEPTVVGPPEIKLPQMGQMGDPLSNIVGPLSNGTGFGGGIGSGSGGGVGSGRGPGVGPGYGGGIGGGVYRVGGGVSAPRALFAPDPEYSDEARKAKFQGTVVLICVVGPDGRPHEIRVARSLGMGLDEKAMEAVRVWRFEPARKDGHPVAVEVSIEVNFRLY